jgi:cytochrome c2
VNAIGTLIISAAALALAGCGDELAQLRNSYATTGLDDSRRIVDGDAGRGRAQLPAHGCSSCHAIPGFKGPAAAVGPPLAGFARRTNIGGTLPNRPQELVRFLMDAPREIPATAMPDLAVTEQEARDIAAFLYTLR